MSPYRSGHQQTSFQPTHLIVNISPKAGGADTDVSVDIQRHEREPFDLAMQLPASVVVTQQPQHIV
jgi:hypothetical protein